MAVATAQLQELPLRRHRTGAFLMGRPVQKLPQFLVILPYLQRQGSLGRSGDHLLTGKILGDPLPHAQTVKTRSCQHNAIQFLFLHPAKPCIDVAADAGETQIRPEPAQQHLSPQAPGTDHRPLGQIPQRCLFPQDQHISWILPLPGPGKGQSLCRDHRHVLHAVHRQPYFTCQKLFLNLTDEEPLPTQIGQGPVCDPVPLCGDHLYLKGMLWVSLPQPVPDVSCLCQSQLRPSCPYPYLHASPSLPVANSRCIISLYHSCSSSLSSCFSSWIGSRRRRCREAFSTFFTILCSLPPRSSFRSR